MKGANVSLNQRTEQLLATENFVKLTLQGAEAGHDWWHIQRVWNNAKLILEDEKADHFVVELAALLHDIADSKFHEGNEELGPAKAAEFLDSIKVEADTVEHVRQIILNMSFKASLATLKFTSPEMRIVQDADRLDAIGAIGIARAFTYGGYKNREIYDPQIEPAANLTREAYKKLASPTINHFYEKLLLLRDQMNTPTARRIASERHKFMEDYLQQFYAEWDGKR